jgi:VanZ family protein
MTRWILRWGPAILIMSIIFACSATPGTDLPSLGTWDFLSKKGGHMLGYALLGAAWLHALNKNGKAARRQLAMAFLFTCLYAASDEWHQQFTPGRTPSARDIGIDAAGSMIGLMFWRCKLKRLDMRNST